MRRTASRTSMLAVAALTVCAPAAFAKPAWVNDIGLDVPDSYRIESAKYGILCRTEDNEVNVWIETILPNELAAVRDEHDRYWRRKGIVLNADPILQTRPGALPVQTAVFLKASWKGAPTIVRTAVVGPTGANKEMILITYWASPESDKAHGADVDRMIRTLDVRAAQ